jgi:hypothetical protein
VAVIVDTLDKGNEILDSGCEMLYPLPVLLEECMDVTMLAQGVVDWQVDL